MHEEEIHLKTKIFVPAGRLQELYASLQLSTTKTTGV